METSESTIVKWVKASDALKQAKKLELELRLGICEDILGDKIKGTKKAKIGQYSLTATAKLTNKLDEVLLKTVWKDLSDSEKECVKFKPSLIVAEYNTLDDGMLIHRAIESKPGTPSLAIKEE